MRIMLSPETSERLETAAALNRRDVNDFADDIVSNALAFAPDDYEAVQEALKAIAEGRERPFEEFIREHESKYPSNLK